MPSSTMDDRERESITAAPLSEIEVMKTALTWEDLGQRWSAAIEKSKDGPRRQFVLPQCSTSTGATATIVLFRLRT